MHAKRGIRVYTNHKLLTKMTGTELLAKALILDIMVEGGLIDSDKMNDTLDELIIQDRKEADTTQED